MELGSDSETEMEVDNEGYQTDGEDEEKDESPFLRNTCLQPENPESEIVSNNQNETLELKVQQSSRITHLLAPGNEFNLTNHK